MKYDQKIRHARAELQDARAAYDKADDFGLQRYISNCLTAARSALQYAYEETGPAGSPARRWYDNGVTAEPLFQFMKGLRDNDIHTAPAETKNTAVVLNTGGPGWVKTDPTTGKIIDAKLPDGEYRRVLMKATLGNRPESALDLLDDYVNKVENFVADGKTKGYLH
jgi:hypothetical protein